MPQKFKVLAGRHIEKKFTLNDKGERKKDARGDYIEKHIVYGPGCAAGDVFESEMDMLRLNSQGYPPKFALVGHEQPTNEWELEERIREDQRRLDEIRRQKGVGRQKASANELPQQSQASTPTAQPASQPHPNVAPKKETEAVRRQQLNAMSVKQLQDIAAAEEVDVATCKSKDDFVRAIMGK